MFFALWYLLAGLIMLAWGYRRLEVGFARHLEPKLSSRSYDCPPDPAPLISVLIAARNEADSIEACVSSLLDQDYPNYEIIVANDRSTDDTAAILDRLEKRAQGLLKVITVRDLPSGWFGKNHAMDAAEKVSRGQWLLFADADCRQTSRRTLSVSMREAIESGADFLSVMPVLEYRHVWERIVQPACAGVLMLWFAPQKVNDPKRKTAYANGAFMLMSRTCYDAIGGHQCVRGEPNEDIHFARIAKEQGLRLRVIQNDDLYVTHMYDTLSQTWRGWSRIFYGCLRRRWRVELAAVLILLLTLLPWVSLIVSVKGWAMADQTNVVQWRIATAVWASVIIVCQWVMASWYRTVRSRARWSLGYVFAATMVLGMLINAILKIAGLTNITWRGTHYRTREPAVKSYQPSAISRQPKEDGPLHLTDS